MSISLRLDDQLTKRLEVCARKYGVSKSELVRRCLRNYLDGEDTRPSAWEFGKDLFGRYGSGRSDLSTNRKQILREKLRAKARRD